VRRTRQPRLGVIEPADLGLRREDQRVDDQQPGEVVRARGVVRSTGVPNHAATATRPASVMR
jgi:hypothetical protein